VHLAGTPDSTRVVDAFAFGAGNVNLFAGSSPNGDYFSTTDPDSHPDGATGLVLENVNFGLVIMRPTDAAHESTKYIALKATANFAGLVGTDGFALSAAGITVEYNAVKSPSETRVVDFSQVSGGAYKVDTGNGELALDYSGKTLLVSI